MESVEGDNIYIEGDGNTIITGDNIMVTQMSGNTDKSSGLTAKLKEILRAYLVYNDERIKNIFLCNYGNLSLR